MADRSAVVAGPVSVTALSGAVGSVCRTLATMIARNTRITARQKSTILTAMTARGTDPGLPDFAARGSAADAQGEGRLDRGACSRMPSLHPLEGEPP